MMKSTHTTVILWFFCAPLLAQVYVEKQTRHRFAQLNLGLDIQSNFGGQTSYLTIDDQLVNQELNSLIKPRFIIGGTHFWGHADLYIAIPVGFPRFETDDLEIYYTGGVETAFKYYPWRIEHNKVRPFVGLSLTPYSYEQNRRGNREIEGPGLTHTTVPLMTGLTFNSGKHLVELGLTWNYTNDIDYYISPVRQVKVQTPPLYAELSYRWMIDTTISAEESWESGRTAERIKVLEQNGGLNGLFVGIGLSSAWWMGESSHNTVIRPFVPDYGISILPDFSLGYYIHKPDINFTLSYRSYGAFVSAYDTKQDLDRRSLAFEVSKYIADYHGFAPFIGPILSYEDLSFVETLAGGLSERSADTQLSYGINFGWDIRPDRQQSIILPLATAKYAYGMQAHAMVQRVSRK
ncbi:MAG: hypothetical protein AAGC88_16970 [Bacteroidota bacterium]